MKYYKTSKFPKYVGGAGFYTLLAVCLLAIGAATWYAVSRYNAATEPPSVPEAQTPIVSESDKQDDAYNSSTVPSVPESVVEKTDTPVSDVPYSEPEEASPAQSFMAPCEGEIIKDFSDSALQFSATYGDMRLHTGVDIACEKGTGVCSSGNGAVTAVDESSSLGKTVTIDHGEGIIIKYCGLDEITVKAGDTVQTGDVFATVGDIPSECSDQSHLHIEATVDGKAMSPFKAIGLE